jgi:serine/threonine-protein kinase
MCLYHALAGRMPFDDVDTIGKLIVAIVTRDLTPLTAVAPWVSPELAAIVHRALRRDPNERVPSAQALIAALLPFTGGSSGITATQLTGVDAALDATLAPGADAPPAAPVASAAEPSGARTTAGVANEESPSPKPKPRAAMWAAVTIAVVAAATATVVAVRSGTRDPGAPAAITATQSAPQPSALPAPSKADDPIKRAVLALKIPSGFTVTIDGKAPGSPDNAAAPKPVEGGALELHGEFQQKFLVAVHDKSGARVMMQDVYMYDGRLDPETIDTKIGPVKVDKPKRDVGAGAPAPRTSSSAATPASSSELPARF